VYRILAIRLYPTKNQVHALTKQLELCRQLYNAATEERKRAWEAKRFRIGRLDQQCQLPELKKQVPEYTDVNANVLQDVIRRVDLAHQRFFKGITGPPKFRKPSRYSSLTYPVHRGGSYVWKGRHIRFSKVGDVRCRMRRLPSWVSTGQPKSCTLKREADQWQAYVRFAVVPPAPQQLPDRVLGLDVGIENFVTTSDGTTFRNLRTFSSQEPRIKRLQRRYDRRRLGGANRAKAQATVARLFMRARRRRLDYHHKVSRAIANTAKTVAVEDGLTGLRRGWLAKQIYDVGWGQFRRLLEYKLTSAGGQLVRVRAAWTSQTCSGCGLRAPKRLAVRIHDCVACGLNLHRDVNAARNIAQLAKVPAKRGEFTPAEIGSHRVEDSVPIMEAGSTSRQRCTT